MDKKIKGKEMKFHVRNLRIYNNLQFSYDASMKGNINIEIIKKLQPWKEVK